MRIANATGGSQQAVLAMPIALSLTSPNTGEGANTNMNDSDGVASGDHANAAVLATDISMSGANKHIFDFGFRAAAAPPCLVPNCRTAEVLRN